MEMKKFPKSGMNSEKRSPDVKYRKVCQNVWEEYLVFHLQKVGVYVG